jgi:hypothetical protein
MAFQAGLAPFQGAPGTGAWRGDSRRQVGVEAVLSSAEFIGAKGVFRLLARRALEEA